MFSLNLSVASVSRVYYYELTTTDQLGPCCSDYQILISFFDPEVHVCEACWEFLVFDFCICDCGTAIVTEIVRPRSFVDEATFPELDEAGLSELAV